MIPQHANALYTLHRNYVYVMLPTPWTWKAKLPLRRQAWFVTNYYRHETNGLIDPFLSFRISACIFSPDERERAVIILHRLNNSGGSGTSCGWLPEKKSETCFYFYPHTCRTRPRCQNGWKTNVVIFGSHFVEGKSIQFKLTAKFQLKFN